MPIINCAEGTLSAFVPSASKPWDEQRAQHLFRRIMLGTNIEEMRNALNQTPENLVNRIVEDAANLPLSPEPEWAYWTLEEYDPDQQIRNEQVVAQVLGWARQWSNDLVNNGLRDRMSFFWHNHFVTILDTYGCPSWMYQYHKLLQTHALGNFKDFVKEMGITPAMLLFLNNVQNTAFDINENYARELYELFTLGVDNGYTQTDIVETARAITGWNGLDVNNLCGTVEFFPALWDSGQKTIFGRTGNWGYDDVIDILFEERAQEISEFICTKLYKHFVNPKVDEFIVADLAQIFRDNNFELKPVLKTLFASDHFFEEANIGTVIPGHIEYFLTFTREFNIYDEELNYLLGYGPSQFGQAMFSPVDVAGWPGNRSWLNSGSLNYRSGSIKDILGYIYQLNGNSLDFITNWVKELVGSNERDPKVVSDAIVHYFLPKGLQFDTEYAEALVVFKSDVPQNYFDLNIWSLDFESTPIQVFFLIDHIANLPEFQLK